MKYMQERLTKTELALSQVSPPRQRVRCPRSALPGGVCTVPGQQVWPMAVKASALLKHLDSMPPRLRQCTYSGPWQSFIHIYLKREKSQR